MATRIAQHRGYRVMGVDLVPERLERARRNGVEVIELGDDTVQEIRDATDGRGPDSVLDAVGMEAHGSGAGGFVQQMTALVPDALAAKIMQRAGMDRLGALHLAIEVVRRGGRSR
jgi:threonine dehydrogenase-like Zn-dependent dehydrogenase